MATASLEQSFLFQRWPLTEPISDLESAPDIPLGLPLFMAQAYWPKQASEQSRALLIVNAGPNISAQFAYHHPNATVVGIEQNPLHLAHALFLKEKHHLNSLQLTSDPLASLLQAPTRFDLIDLTEALPRTENPKQLLRLAQSLLTPDGVITLSLPSPDGRYGIAQIRTLCRLLGLDNTQADLNLLKGTLPTLQANHPIRFTSPGLIDFNDDAALVDLFLSDLVPTYAVADCFSLLEGTDLVFQDWMDPMDYSVEGFIPKNHPLYEKLSGLSKQKQYAVMEALNGRMSHHTFFVTPSSRNPHDYVLSFDGWDFLTYVPIFHPMSQTGTLDTEKGSVPFLGRPPHSQKVLLDPIQNALLRQVDGHKTIKACLDEAGISGHPNTIVELGRTFFQNIGRLGHIQFKKP